MLPDSLERFISHRRIDSFHKIWFHLFLHQHSMKHQINREYIRQVTFTDAPTLDEAIEELQDAGLLNCIGEVLSLDDAPDVRCQLDTMAHVFEDPSGRQALLRRLYRHAPVPLQDGPGNVTSHAKVRGAGSVNGQRGQADGMAEDEGHSCNCQKKVSQT